TIANTLATGLGGHFRIRPGSATIRTLPVARRPSPVAAASPAPIRDLPPMTLTTRVLIGLVAGLAFGIALATWLPPSWQQVAVWIEPAGAIWTRALQMMVIPLVVTLLFTGVSSGGRGLGALGLKGIAFFVITLCAVAALPIAV